MPNDEYRSMYIDKIKDIASSLDETADDSILCELEYYVESLREHIEWQHAAYYVAIWDYGPEDNFVRYYTPLGKMTVEKARNKLSEISSGRHNDHVEKVSKEQYEDLKRLRHLTEISYNSLMLNRYDDIPQDFSKIIQEKIKALREKVGFKHHWEMVN